MHNFPKILLLCLSYKILDLELHVWFRVVREEMTRHWRVLVTVYLALESKDTRFGSHGEAPKLGGDLRGACVAGQNYEGRIGEEGESESLGLQYYIRWVPESGK